MPIVTIVLLGPAMACGVLAHSYLALHAVICILVGAAVFAGMLYLYLNIPPRVTSIGFGSLAAIVIAITSYASGHDVLWACLFGVVAGVIVAVLYGPIIQITS